jgi:hypothetical protein
MPLTRMGSFCLLASLGVIVLLLIQRYAPYASSGTSSGSAGAGGYYESWVRTEGESFFRKKTREGADSCLGMSSYLHSSSLPSMGLPSSSSMGLTNGSGAGGRRARARPSATLPVPVPVPVPNLTKKSREQGRRVPTVARLGEWCVVSFLPSSPAFSLFPTPSLPSLLLCALLEDDN